MKAPWNHSWSYERVGLRRRACHGHTTRHDGHGSEPRARRAVDLARITVSAEAIRALPAEFVKSRRILPLEIREGTLHLATPIRVTRGWWMTSGC